MEKKEIRKQALQKRNELTKEYRTQANDEIYKRLITLESYRRAKVILSYVSYKSEVDTKKILEMAFKDGKTVAVPKVLERNGRMEFYEIQSLQELEVGYQGIEEPNIVGKSPIEPEAMREHWLMIMPGAAFDSQGNRIGYGGGFYDRYLHRHPDVMETIAICYEIQMVEKIPTQAFDVRTDRIITEQRMITTV